MEAMSDKYALMVLNIVTPCTRISNLPKILGSILESKKQIPITIDWYIVVDAQVADINENILSSLRQTKDIAIKVDFFHAKLNEKLDPRWARADPARNQALDVIQQGLVCFVDDDNLVHPSYIERMYQITKQGRDSNIGIIYSQMITKRPVNSVVRIARVDMIKPSSIDVAQYTISRQLIGANRFPACHQSDGVFIQGIYRCHPNQFVIVAQPLCYYNALSDRGKPSR